MTQVSEGEIGLRIFVEEFTEAYEGKVRDDLDEKKVIRLIQELRQEKDISAKARKKEVDKKYTASAKGRERQERSNAKRREKRRLAKLEREAKKKEMTKC